MKVSYVIKGILSGAGKLRIGVDLAPLRPPLTGVGNYELHLLSAILNEPDAPQIIGFNKHTWVNVNRSYIDGFSAMSGRDSTEHVRSWTAKAVHVLRRSKSARRLYLWIRRRIFERSCNHKELSLFHAFSYVAPGKTSTMVIPVVYDLSFVRFPESHPPARLESLRYFQAQLTAAPLVHTISQFSAREIADVFGIPSSRIAVIYPGVSAEFIDTVSQNTEAVLAHYKLERMGFFLVVSTLEPRKNLRSLIAAYSRLSSTERGRLPLCIVGATGWGSLDLPASTHALEREGCLRFLGFIPNLHLRALYENTKAMFYPSSYEGFGMPIIEALACGARVISSDAASMPEAGGPVTRRVSPYDVDAWLEEMRFAAAVSDSGSEERIARQSHALQFTWSRAAVQTLDLYRRAMFYKPRD